MRLSSRGVPRNIIKPIVGRIARKGTGAPSEAIYLVQAGGDVPDQISSYRALITTGPVLDLGATEIPTIHGLREDDHLRDGDIVALDSTGGVRTLFRPDSVHNTLFVTEQCNSNCLMCSQPPRDVDDIKHFLAINSELIRLIPLTTTALGITGGEPTLLQADLLHLLELLRDRLPHTHIHVLTNGRSFAQPQFTAVLAAVRHPDLMLGIPLYSDAAHLHDYIVQARGAFDETVVGLHHLARHRVHVEIRIVLHKLSVPRLRHLVEFVYRNLPFAAHIALMGLEPTGYVPYNREKLWIDPFDYRDELLCSVDFLNMRGMSVSIYNIPRCLLPESLWAFAKQSISDWKNVYLPVCESCLERNQCAGFFQSADRIHSAHIEPFLPGV